MQLPGVSNFRGWWLSLHSMWMNTECAKGKTSDKCTGKTRAKAEDQYVPCRQSRRLPCEAALVIISWLQRLLEKALLASI